MKNSENFAGTEAMMKYFSALAFTLLASSVVGQPADYKQSAPPDAFIDGSERAYYGSENEWSRRMFSAENAAKDYKRLGQHQLLSIIDRQPTEVLRSELDDGETLFMRAIAYCQLGRVAEANEAMHRALEAGLPLERFVAGPRMMLAPLTGSPEFRAYLAKHPVDLIHGPMLGNVTDRSACVWVRSAKESAVTLRVFADAERRQLLHTARATIDPRRDYTGVVCATGLNPATEYRYEVQLDGGTVTDAARGAFRTVPTPGQRSKFRIAFGGCAGYTPWHERMWDTIRAEQPAAMLFLGDNVYIDLPEHPGPLHQYTYYCRQSRPEFRRLVSSVPVYAIWDDHDSAIDDVWLGPFRDKPDWKQPLFEHFQENWINPLSGSPPEWPGGWFRFLIGDVEFFMLDCRIYRTNPFADEKTMLGPAQLAWLLDGLQKSEATFKVIASSVPFSEASKPGSHDTWGGFPEEREQIFSTISKDKIDGVLLLSADRHRSEAWRIDRPGAYPLYDFGSARLTNVHTHECVDGALFCYNEKCSFGLVDFDTTADDPTAIYRIVNIDGQTVYELKLKRSELSVRTP
jgi:alkaline phosphatase D